MALLLAPAATASAQALFVKVGERAGEASGGWSVGPSSQGYELAVAGTLDGRWDVGVGLNKYWLDFGVNDSEFSELTAFGRYFLFKEGEDNTPVSFAAHGQAFVDYFEGDDAGWYLLGGGTLYKRFEMTDTFALYPHVGFSLAVESYTFGGAPAERVIYLTRQFGVHGLLTLTDRMWVRVSAEEHSFRRETYRAVRGAVVRRF